MMNDPAGIERLVRRNIRELKPYSSAREEYSGSASVFLDANENPFNAPLNRYPDPVQRELKKVLSLQRGVPAENIFLGNGSDEGIDLLFRILCDPGRDNVVVAEPTYGMYGVCADIHDTDRRTAWLHADFSLSADAVLRRVDERTKMIFLCSPNNPTSNSFRREEMVRVIDEADCMVVVDEAYIDFSRQAGVRDLLTEKPNLVVLQTLSKAWGLAGIRLGMVFAHQQMITYLSRVKYPYNVNTLTMQAALEALGEAAQTGDWLKRILAQRERLRMRLQGYSFVEKVFPSDANFLLVRMKHPRRIYRYLLQRGIIVRDRSKVPLCEGCLRFTVGTEEENTRLLEALDSYPGEPDKGSE